MSASLLVALAWRNLRRNLRRTALLVAAVTVGVAGLVLMAAFLRGWLDATVEVALDALNGHVRVHDEAWLADPGADASFVLDEALRRRFASDTGVVAWAPRVRIPAVVMSERETRGVMLVGIDPPAELGLSFVADATLRGRGLAGSDDGGLLLGAALADALGTDVGKRVVLLTQDADGRTVERGHRIVGVLDVPSDALEKGFVFTGRRDLALRHGLEPDSVTEISARLDRAGAAALDARVAALQHDLAPLAVRSWRDLVPQAAAMVEVSRGSIWVVYVVTMTALAFGLVNTLLASVIERVRELGLLQAVGMRPSGVLWQVIIESALILAAGLAVGLALGLVAVEGLWADGIDLGAWAGAVEMAGVGSVLHPVIETEDLVRIVAVVVVLGALASIYPARKAVAIDPLDAVNRLAE